MGSKRIRYLIAFVAATLLLNSAAAAARAFITGLSAHDIVAVQAVDAAGAANDDQDPCLTHCVQSNQNHKQELATNSFKAAFLPALFVPCFSVEIKPVAFVVVLAPQAAGAALTILFRNLRI